MPAQIFVRKPQLEASSYLCRIFFIFPKKRSLFGGGCQSVAPLSHAEEKHTAVAFQWNLRSVDVSHYLRKSPGFPSPFSLLFTLAVSKYPQ